MCSRTDFEVNIIRKKLFEYCIMSHKSWSRSKYTNNVMNKIGYTRVFLRQDQA